MGDVHHLPLRNLPPAPPDCSAIRAWELLRSGARITHGTLGDLVAMLDAGAPPADVFAQIDILNTQLAACGSCVTFLKATDAPPSAARRRRRTRATSAAGSSARCRVAA